MTNGARRGDPTNCARGTGGLAATTGARRRERAGLAFDALDFFERLALFVMTVQSWRRSPLSPAAGTALAAGRARGRSRAPRGPPRTVLHDLVLLLAARHVKSEEYRPDPLGMLVSVTDAGGEFPGHHLQAVLGGTLGHALLQLRVFLEYAHCAPEGAVDDVPLRHDGDPHV
jgi:hypothetical protein